MQHAAPMNASKLLFFNAVQRYLSKTKNRLNFHIVSCGCMKWDKPQSLK